MKRFDGVDTVAFPRSVVAIGVFDGVHLGHQSVLRCVSEFARTVDGGASAVAVTFDVHPSHVLAPDRAPASISTLDQQIALMEEYGGRLDAAVVIRFTREFAQMTPDEFVQGVLLDRLGVRHVFIGGDFRYGHGRIGTVNTLREEGERFGFGVTVVPPVIFDGGRVSSTRIRSLIAGGDLAGAVRLLGHPFALAGTVVRGKQLGRQLGFPTANVSPLDPAQLLPADGVYGGYAVLPSGESVRAAVSIGTNPTTDSDGARKVEAYLLDGFSEDLYNARIQIDFRHYIRDLVRFDSLGDLIAQIKSDVSDVERVVAPLTEVA